MFQENPGEKGRDQRRDGHGDQHVGHSCEVMAIMKAVVITAQQPSPKATGLREAPARSRHRRAPRMAVSADGERCGGGQAAPESHFEALRCVQVARNYPGDAPQKVTQYHQGDSA